MKLVMKILRQLLMNKKISTIERSMRMMNSQKSDAEKVNLIEEGKKIVINEVIKRNEIITKSLKR